MGTRLMYGVWAVEKLVFLKLTCGNADNIMEILASQLPKLKENKSKHITWHRSTQKTGFRERLAY